MGKLLDVPNNCGNEVAVDPATHTADFDGTGIDRTDLGGRGFFAGVMDNIGGTSPVFSFQVQDSDDDGVADAYADTDDAAVTVAADGAFEVPVKLEGLKKYVRVTCTVTGTSPTGDVAALLVAAKRPEVPPS